MTEQMTCFLLPSLAETSSQFPFGFLLESLLILLSKADSSGARNFRVTPSPWLLFGVLAFVDKNLGNYFVFSVIESRILTVSRHAGLDTFVVYLRPLSLFTFVQDFIRCISTASNVTKCPLSLSFWGAKARDNFQSRKASGNEPIYLVFSLTLLYY